MSKIAEERLLYGLLRACKKIRVAFSDRVTKDDSVELTIIDRDSTNEGVPMYIKNLEMVSKDGTLAGYRKDEVCFSDVMSTLRDVMADWVDRDMYEWNFDIYQIDGYFNTFELVIHVRKVKESKK